MKKEVGEKDSGNPAGYRFEIILEKIDEVRMQLEEVQTEAEVEKIIEDYPFLKQIVNGKWNNRRGVKPRRRRRYMENEEKIYSCSVVLSMQNIINIVGTIDEIKEKLKFIAGSLFYVKNPDNFASDDFIMPEPCILTQENDINSYKEECR